MISFAVIFPPESNCQAWSTVDNTYHQVRDNNTHYKAPVNNTYYQATDNNLYHEVNDNDTHF